MWVYLAYEVGIRVGLADYEALAPQSEFHVYQWGCGALITRWVY
jgi:hypothetical protein